MIFALISLVFASNNLHHLSLDSAWDKWGSLYRDAETIKGHGLTAERKEIFADNYARVRMHNSRNHTFWLELNEYAALTSEEFNVRNGFMGETVRSFKSVHPHKEIGGAPDSIDWRGKLVTPVKNQGSCGSCWAFSTVVGLEGQYAKLTNTLLSLSEQDIVDCVKNVVLPGQSDKCCNGCQGGLMDYAFYYMIHSQSGADDTEANYGYTGTNEACKFSASGAFSDAKITKYTDVTTGESGLQDAVANVGPISVAVNAGGFWWQLYGGGVFSHSCNSDPSKLDHGVAVVGYGTDSGKDYWIIKNSWGAGWGEKGYIRLQKGSNLCGVSDQPSYPTVESN